jgi:alpha-tubulin suppressor-like RCC1 family protein
VSLLRSMLGERRPAPAASSSSNRRSHVRSLFVLASVLGTALSLLSTACDDSDGALAGGASDAAADAPNAPPADAPDAHASDSGAASDPRGPYDPADVPVACDASPCATQIVAGSDHFCVRMSDGAVRCWGDDAFGVLGTIPEPGDGDGNGDAGSTVHAIADLSSVAHLSAAGATTCALLDDGRVKCWGDNRRAQLGLERDYPAADWEPHPTPSLVPLEEDATKVDVGHGVVCARLASGKLSCWGSDHQGQLVRAGDDVELYPDLMRGPGLAAIEPLSLMRVAASTHTVLGLAADGSVWSWGALAGELGTVSGRIGSITPSRLPKRLEALSNVTSLVASAWVEPSSDPMVSRPLPGEEPPKVPPKAHACALAGGEVHCWGRSYQGALCTGFRDDEQEPALAPFPRSAKTWPQQLAVADEITCARTTDGSVYCCGSDTRGRLGTGTVGVLSASFTKAKAFARYAVQVATTDRAVCALVVDGTVECWGSNEKGELGQSPDGADHSSPVRVAF